jgi:hypothetical protein
MNYTQERKGSGAVKQKGTADPAVRTLLVPFIAAAHLGI